MASVGVVCPVKPKTVAEVAPELPLIFLGVGILPPDNGREFTVQVNFVHELASLWPNLPLINGWSRHPQSQVGICGMEERCNGDLKLRVMARMRANNRARWSCGVCFSQWALNRVGICTRSMQQ